MIKTMATTLIVAGVLATGVAMAQQMCPNGLSPISHPGCVVGEGQDSGGGRELFEESYQLPPQQPIQQSQSWRNVHWADRYGAYAHDPVRGAMGFTTQARSIKQANENALNECRLAGGLECIIGFGFRNGCAVVAGVRKEIKGYHSIDSSRSKARREALGKCRAAERNACEVIFEECAQPVLVVE